MTVDITDKHLECKEMAPEKKKEGFTKQSFHKLKSTV